MINKARYDYEEDRSLAAWAGLIMGKPTIDNAELLSKHGHIKFNDFRTIQQAWDKLNSTPYHESKAPQYRMLRQIMLDDENKTDG